MRDDRCHRLPYDLLGEIRGYFAAGLYRFGADGLRTGCLLREYVVCDFHRSGDQTTLRMQDYLPDDQRACETRLGVEQQLTEGRTQEEWMRHLYEQSRAQFLNCQRLKNSASRGSLNSATQTRASAMHKASPVEDPDANPLTTPSGRSKFLIRSTLRRDRGDLGTAGR